jgi:hypothetical protein
MKAPRNPMQFEYFVRFYVHNFAIFTQPEVYAPKKSESGYQYFDLIYQLLTEDFPDYEILKISEQLWCKICTHISNI